MGKPSNPEEGNILQPKRNILSAGAFLEISKEKAYLASSCIIYHYTYNCRLANFITE